MANSVDIVLPLFSELSARNIDNIQLFGGIGSAALVAPGLHIGDASQVLYLNDDIDLPQYRDNGTLRDVDVMVLSADSDKIAQAEAVGQQVIGDELELSFFGLLSFEALDIQAAHPIRSLGKRFLADRYVDQDESGTIIQALKAVYPFSVPLDRATLETWTLTYQNHNIPVPHPGTVVLNYLTRSLSGLRTKDTSKVAEVADNVFSKSPEIKEWVLDGPGSSLIHLARALHTLREPRTAPTTLQVGEHITLAPLSSDKIVEMALPMMDGQGIHAQHAILILTRLKARGLHVAESQEKLVAFWQRSVERRIDGVIKNQ